MSEPTYHAPKIRPIVFGIILFVLFLIMLCSLSDLIKLAGYPFLWLPEKIGLVQVAHPADVRVIQMAQGPVTTMEFAQPGNYAVYTNDYDLLLASADLANRDGRPWVNAKAPSGAPDKVTYFKRGLRPYDSPFAKGRPVLLIQVTETGQHTLRHPSKVGQLSIVPDYTTGNEFTLYFSYVVQLVILLLPVLYLFQRYRQRNLARVKSVKQLKHISGDDFWKRELKRSKEGEVKKPKDVYHTNKWW